MQTFHVTATNTHLNITRVSLEYSGNSVEVTVEFETPLKTPSGLTITTKAVTKFMVSSADNYYEVMTGPAKAVAGRLSSVKEPSKDSVAPRGLPTS